MEYIIGIFCVLFYLLIYVVVSKHHKINKKIESRKLNNCNENNEKCCSDCICYDK